MCVVAVAGALVPASAQAASQQPEEEHRILVILASYIYSMYVVNE